MTVAEPVPGDLRMIRTLWPVLLASAVGLVPFTVFSTFLVPIAGEAGTSVATMGSLRGLGGLAALLVGTALAPLIDRVPREWTAAGGLVLLGLSSVIGALGDLLALAAFCLLIGAATAVLNPALGAAAADRYGSGAAAGRAATLVTATQSLTAMLAAPVVALPALLWGWRGDLIALGAVAVLLAVILLGRRGEAVAESDQPRLGYLASFRALAAVPGALPLVLVAALRTSAFMGYLAYLAAFYDERFALSPEVFAFVWTLSGASFFVGNLLVGRFINAAGASTRIEAVLVGGLVVALAAIIGFYFSPVLPVALVLTAVLGLAHATVAACVVSLLVHRSGSLRGSALSINAAGMSLGVFAGAGLGGIGLGLGGYPGTAAVFGGLTLVALLAGAMVLRGRSTGPA
ncbi:MFS transporter [Amycolatopsis cihanbeyliensis]|uniref:Putative MFS family arabinose efflux permease n=1 Tax=Amycolatopsis cihanbeyliensis TaxID=1128664 RepID=A0A542DRQ9_AMYCI|nr:MFS transporter [Amycolatopsis cihanbeyliensis]TQJ05793.1 putative MFS family arabinose efflux permease [Amycolatopsis cihanbeyliensis]